MFLSARPLLDNSVDAELFVDRDEEQAAVSTAINSGVNVLVSGKRGMGRTSLLRRVQYQSRQPSSGLVGDFPMEFVRVEGIDDGVELLRRIVQVVVDEEPGLSDPDRLLQMLSVHREDLIEGTRERWRGEGVDAHLIAGSRLMPTIILDDVNARAGHALFGRYRDEVWATGYLWVVSVREDDRAGLLTPPADAFFERVVELSPLPVAARVLLLERRVGASLDSTGAAVGDAVGGNPRALVGALRELLEPDGAGGHRIMQRQWEALGARDNAIHATGRPASMLAAEMKVRGAVSASDEDLLSSLGWTRPRVVQVLQQLSERGLVTVRDQVTGRGRPRKVYELTPPEDWWAHHGGNDGELE